MQRGMLSFPYGYPSIPQGGIPFEGGMNDPYKQPFIGLPFEGGDPGKGGLYGPFSGPFNNMGANEPRNALMGLGGGLRRPGMMNTRQRY